MMMTETTSMTAMIRECLRLRRCTVPALTIRCLVDRLTLTRPRLHVSMTPHILRTSPHRLSVVLTYRAARLLALILYISPSISPVLSLSLVFPVLLSLVIYTQVLADRYGTGALDPASHPLDRLEVVSTVHFPSYLASPVPVVLPPLSMHEYCIVRWACAGLQQCETGVRRPPCVQATAVRSGSVVEPIRARKFAHTTSTLTGGGSHNAFLPATSNAQSALSL